MQREELTVQPLLDSSFVGRGARTASIDLSETNGSCAACSARVSLTGTLLSKTPRKRIMARVTLRSSLLCFVLVSVSEASFASPDGGTLAGSASSVGGGLLGGLGVRASGSRRDREPESELSEEEGPSERRSLRARVGVPLARELLLGSSALADRLRALERLSRRGDRESLEVLVDALDSGGAVIEAPQTRLAAARALAPHAATEAGRRGLELIIAHSLDEDIPRALGALARDTAVIALARAAAGHVVEPEWSKRRGKARQGARSVTELALTPLLASLIGGSPVGRTAEEALLSFPPRELGAFVRGVATMTPAEVRVLGRLRDPRALAMLRRTFERSESVSKLDSALALARLGDHGGVEEFRRVLSASDATQGAALLALEGLLTLGDPGASTRLGEWLRTPDRLRGALELAERFPSRKLLTALGAALGTKPSAEDLPRIVRLLVRIGGDRAVEPLLDALATSAKDPFVIEALIRLEADSLDGRLAELLAQAKPSVHSTLLRLCAARLHARAESGSSPGALHRACRESLEAASAAPGATERAVGWWGLVLLGAREVADGIASDDPVIRGATVSAAGALPFEAMRALRPAARRALEPGSSDPVEEAALGLVLLADPTFASAAQLAQIAESGGDASAQAAYRLGVRDTDDVRWRIDALLDGTAPLIRAHVALGLGESRDPSALARLERAFEREYDLGVRRAIVRAVSQRREHGRERLLELAESLDPDAEVRRLASLAKRGARHAVVGGTPRRPSVFLLRAGDARADGAVTERLVSVMESGRLARLSLALADGLVLAFGVDDEGPDLLPHLQRR